MKILIADDEYAFRHLLEEILVKWGYEVVIAQDGDEAWQALKAENAPQLAILDWLMPGIDGVEICRKVRKEPLGPYTYLILLTSQHRDEDLVTGMEAGADDYIFKPFKVDELRVRLNAGKRMIDLQNELTERASDLEAANRNLASFSYTVSNDILNSLLTIGDYAYAIRDFSCDKGDELCHNNAKLIYNKIKYLGTLIGMMHDFFRPLRIDLQRVTVDLSELVASITEKFRQTNPDRQVTFRIADGIKINADRNLMQTALNNLIGNAWKHTAKKEEAVIEFGVKEVEQITIYFVRDNGTGFDMALADRLFKPFRPMPGTEDFASDGIGLATVERIIRRHGGKVWAEGELGKGATFYFTL